MAQSVPAGADIGAQAERFKQEITERQAAVEKSAAKVPMIEAAEWVPRGAMDPTVRFLLQEVRVTGATIFKPEILAMTYGFVIGREVSVADLSKIAARIKREYQVKGHMTTVVFIPEQEIRDGVVEVRVIEGRQGKLTIEGNRRVSQERLRRYMHSAEGDVLNLKTMLSDIIRLNESPDVQVRTVLTPGAAPETSDITLKVTEQRPWHAGMSIDNTGTRLSGRYRTGFYVRTSDLTGNLDSLFLNTSFTHDSAGQYVSYRRPVGTRGLKVGMDATYYNMKDGKEYRPFDIVGTTQIYTPQVIKELWLKEKSQAHLTAGMDIKCVSKYIGLTKNTSDQLRIPFVAMDISRDDALGQTVLRPRLDVPLKGVLGASGRNDPLASRAGTGGSSIRYTQDLDRTQRMPWGSYATLKTTFQAASRSLPSSEQLQLGGMNSVRGYSEGEYSADSGVVVNADWFFPLPVPADWKIPSQKESLRRQVMPVVFADYGRGNLKRVVGSERDHKEIWGAGAGFRIRISNRASIRLEWAKAMGADKAPGNGPSTFYVQIFGEF